MKRNRQIELDGILADLKSTGERPSLLLHCCCAPCSSYVLEYLSPFFDITAWFYNPNIDGKEEAEKRREELKRLIKETDPQGKIRFEEGGYDPKDFLAAVRGHEEDPEGGERCGICFALRLQNAARYAAEHGYDFVTTTLTISPLKNADRINEIGEAAAGEAGVRWLPSDFKKKDGYKRSIELSREYGLYRQNYCGCRFSKKAACDKMTDNNTR